MHPVVAQFSMNMQSDDAGLALFLLVVAVVTFILWLRELVSLLKRQDMKDVDKIVWTIVLCTLNLLGLVIYWFLAPPKAKRSIARSEKELKDYFNSRGGPGPNQPN